MSNSSGDDGGGMANKNYSTATVSNCIFAGNTAEWGGGLSNESSSPYVTNCLFWSNSVNGDGGGMWNISSEAEITNCTLFANYAGNYGGGIFNASVSPPTITNCILWLNISEVWDDEICNYTCTPIVTYCDVKGGYSGTGNIDADPQFIDSESGDLHLSHNSPCIDAGNNTAVPGVVTTDLDGLNRKIDGDCDSTVTVDMGVYEFDWIFLGDFAGGCDVNLSDFAVLASNWQQNNLAIDIAPYLEPDGIIDIQELQILVANWLAGIAY